MAGSPKRPEWLRQLRKEDWDAPIDLDRTTRTILEGLRRGFRAASAEMFLLDRKRGELVARVLDGSDLREIRIPRATAAAGLCVSTVGPIRIDAGTDERITEGDRERAGGAIANLLAVPLFDPAAITRTPADVVGVLQLVGRKSGFTPALQERLTDLALDVAGLLFRTSLRYDLRSKTRRPLAWRLSHVVGAGPKLQAAVGRILRASKTDVSVLIRGETGSGKELLARALHANSPRRQGPLVKVDCAALPVELIENELFGHEKGAFRGAGAGADGKVAAAEGGTLFLDEIGDLPLAVQGKLLRLVQDRTYHRLGGQAVRKADVRFVASTHRNLEAEVRGDLFRRDLYFRLRVVEVRLPPLRERSRADVDRLIDYFLHRFGEVHGRAGLRLSEPARETLLAHTWPGNIRELENCIESAVVLTEGPKIQPKDLPLVDPRTLGMPVVPTSASQLIEATPGDATLREMEDRWIMEVLDRAGGNRTKAAEILGIGRNTLLRRLRRASIDDVDPEDTLPP